MDGELMTRKAAATVLGIHPESLGRKIRTGEVPAYTIGSDRRRRYVRRDDIARLSEPMLATPSRGPQAASPRTSS